MSKSQISAKDEVRVPTRGQLIGVLPRALQFGVSFPEAGEFIHQSTSQHIECQKNPEGSPLVPLHQARHASESFSVLHG